jgi:L-threonylcarbamoyladenylate synthase
MQKKMYLCRLNMCKAYDISDLEQAIRVLQSGGVILYPTDTVWGIGCDATNEQAVARVYSIKEREDTKSMLVLVDSSERLDAYPDLPEQARPTTVIYPNAHGLAKNLIAADGSIGIRITNEAFSQALCRQFGKPIVSTSANISGEPTARNFGQISQKIIERVDYICRYRQDDTSECAPSRIIKIEKDGSIKVIRD